MTSELSNQELTGTLAEHWRKGIPTLLLAILGLGTYCYSTWSVQPRIESTYQAICERNWKLLGIDSNSIQPQHALPASALDPQQQQRLLEEIQLSLRRLIGLQNQSGELLFQSGLTSYLLANHYLSLATKSDLEPKTELEMRLLLSKAEGARRKSLESMKRAQKMQGESSVKARVWLTNRQLQDSIEFLPADLKDMEDSLRTVADIVSVSSTVRPLLGKVLVEKSLRMSSGLDRSARLATLTEAMGYFDEQSDVTLKAFATEMKHALGRGNEEANATLQAFWSMPDDPGKSLVLRVSAFRSLLIVNSLRESQLFVSEQLKILPPVEQSRFRIMAASACLRHLVASIVLLERAKESRLENEIVLSLAIQLNPESSELVAFLEKVVSPNSDEEIALRFRRAFHIEEYARTSPEQTADFNPVASSDESRLVPSKVEENSLHGLLEAMQDFANGGIDFKSDVNLTKAVKASPAYGLTASRFALSRLNSDFASTDQTIRWMKLINVANPEVLAAWSDRASLHLKEKQFEEAIECLAFLHDRLPANEQIKEALQAAKDKVRQASD